MPQFTFTPLVPKSSENVNTLNNILTQAQASINSVDEAQLANGVLQKLGLNNGSQIGRGAAVIPATQSTTSTTYVALATPDQVAGLVLPSTGYFRVTYFATWQESVSAAARAAIFLTPSGGSNFQLKRAQQNLAAPTTQEADLGGTTGVDTPLVSYPGGLMSGVTSSAYSGDVTTGQTMSLSADSADTALTFGGETKIFAAAGTYTISVFFKTSSGTVTVKNRRLYVEAVGF